MQLLVLAAALAACALAGPAVAPQSAAAGEKSTDWKMAFSDAIDFQSNVFASFDSTPYFIFTEVYDTLLNYNLKDGGPDLVNSPTRAYTISPDGLTYTFHLRPGMRWSDGKPFTAADVVFSYEHAADSNVNSTYTENMKSVDGAQPDDGADDALPLRRPLPDRVRPDRAGAHLGAACRHARPPHQVQPVLPDGRERRRSR